MSMDELELDAYMSWCGEAERFGFSAPEFTFWERKLPWVRRRLVEEYYERAMRCWDSWMRYRRSAGVQLNEKQGRELRKKMDAYQRNMWVAAGLVNKWF